MLKFAISDCVFAFGGCKRLPMRTQHQHPTSNWARIIIWFLSIRRVFEIRFSVGVYKKSRIQTLLHVKWKENRWMEDIQTNGAKYSWMHLHVLNCKSQRMNGNQPFLNLKLSDFIAIYCLYVRVCESMRA